MPLPEDVSACFKEANTSLIALKEAVETAFEFADQALSERVKDLESELEEKRDAISRLEQQLKDRDLDVERLEEKVKRLEEEAAADAAVSGRVGNKAIADGDSESPPALRRRPAPERSPSPRQRPAAKRAKSVSPSEEKEGRAGNNSSRGAKPRSRSRSRDRGSDGGGGRRAAARGGGSQSVSPARRRENDRGRSPDNRRNDSVRSPDNRGNDRGRSPDNRSPGRGDRDRRRREETSRRDDSREPQHSSAGKESGKDKGPGSREALCIPFVTLGKCKIGDKCWNRHPRDEQIAEARLALQHKRCKFGAQCKRSDCIFKHDDDGGSKKYDDGASKRYDDGGSKRYEKPASNKEMPLCRYGDACKRPDCKFRHEYGKGSKGGSNSWGSNR